MRRLLTIDWKNNITRYSIINTVILVFTGLFLILFAVFTFFAVTTTQNIEDARKDRDRIEGEISYFNLAQKLANDQVDVYNDALLQLIPEQEDYFLLIASIERFSQRTGIKIKTYSIALAGKGSEKYTLTISGTFSPNQLKQFLNTYQYGTGRLVTIESMSLAHSTSPSGQPQDDIQLTMNFYSRKVTTSSINRVGSLSQEDITLMDTVVQKMKEGEQRGVQKAQ